MPNYTPKYNLEKPLPEEFYDVNVQNSNMDKIEAAFGQTLGASAYFDDMNALTTAGIYRVGANTNLHQDLWYGHVLVMIGTQTDTIAQLGMDYTSSKIIARSGKLEGGTWTFADWATFYSNMNKPTATDVGALSNKGGNITGTLTISNTDLFTGVLKTRTVDSQLYTNEFAIGSDTTRGAASTLRLTDESGAVKGRLDLWSNGTITYSPNGSNYHELFGSHNIAALSTALGAAKIAQGTYKGTGDPNMGGYTGSFSFTLPFAPKMLLIVSGGSHNNWGLWTLNGSTVKGVFAKTGTSSSTNNMQNPNSVSFSTSTKKFTITSSNAQTGVSATNYLNSSSCTYYWVAIA